MKLIVLSAFGGRLVSPQPIEWPDEPLHLRLPMSKSMGGSCGLGLQAELAPPMMKIAIFEHTGKYQLLENKQTAAIYELVDL